MKDLIREAPLGQILRLISGNRLLKYPEEISRFDLPFEKLPVQGHDSGFDEKNASKGTSPRSPSTDLHNSQDGGDFGKELDKQKTQDDNDFADVEKSNTHASSQDLAKLQSLKSLSRISTKPHTRERLEAEAIMAAQRTKSIPIQPQVTASGKILVTWYTTDDPANPQNWSQSKKSYVLFLIWIYTFAVYASSSIYVSSEEGIMAHFGVQPFKASLGLALFVLGYGIGPLLFSPLSEIPIIGRNIPYISSFALFVILSVPTALVDNLGGLLFLRFLQGFFGSPCLATGAATLQDMYSMLYVPVALSVWVSAAFSAPSLAPLLSGFAVMAEGWRWSLWEILWMSGPVFIAWFITMPETLEDNILLRRARRLRKLTGDDRYVSQSEINQANLSTRQIVIDALVKPAEINIKDPAITFTSLYAGIIYAIYYSFFEAFPIVYGEFYGFNIGEVGLVFTSIAVGTMIGLTIYNVVLLKVVIPTIQKSGPGPQEDVLRLALIFVWGPTISLFVFAWTSRPDIHWIVPTIFLAIYPLSVFIVMQTVFAYIPMSYPRYAASLFAGNDFVRSFFAFGCVLFSRSLYVDLGIGKGVTLVGGLSLLGPLGIYYLFYNGAKMRAKSKFAVHEDKDDTVEG